MTSNSVVPPLYDEIAATTGRLVVDAARLLVGVYNQDDSYLRRRSLRAALVLLADVARDALPDVILQLPPADDPIL